MSLQGPLGRRRLQGPGQAIGGWSIHMGALGESSSSGMKPNGPSLEPASWETSREALGVVLMRRHLRRTATTALVVGTLLFCINQLDVVLRGDATALVWVKVGVTYFVPFAVSNIGVLIGTRSTRSS